MADRKIKILFLIICTLQIFYIFYFRSGFRYEVIKNPFREDAGIIYALSPKVVESKDLLRIYKAIDFNLSESLKVETYFYQRSIEFNYPIRINKTSKLIFFSREEDIPNTCKLIEAGKYLKLSKC